MWTPNRARCRRSLLEPARRGWRIAAPPRATRLGFARRSDPTLVTDHGAAERTPGPPTRVGRYVIEGVLGSGGTATVYLARDPTLDRPVALKLIRGDEDAYAPSRLLREGQALARISHPNVIHVYEAGRADGVVYIAMERIDGVTLAAWLRRERDPRAILAAFADAGRGLAAAHAAGLVHRDFKPENVLVGRDGQVRVVDFGLARAPGGEASAHLGAITPVTLVGTVVGTPAYMSPEQWRGESTTVRSDQFSFCVALIRALTGKHPFDARSRARLRDAVVAGRYTLPRSIPRRLRPVLRRGLAAAPEDRFPSIGEIVDALEQPPRLARPSARVTGGR